MLMTFYGYLNADCLLIYPKIKIIIITTRICMRKLQTEQQKTNLIALHSEAKSEL